MSEWRTTTWGDLSKLHYGKALRGYQGGSGPVEVFGTNGPIGWTGSQLFPPGVIVGRKGAYRGIHYAKGPCWVIDTAFWLETNIEQVDPRWAYWQLQTVDLNSIDSGSAIPSTSRDAFAQIPVILPPLPVQRGVVAVLDSLDDLIENNQRRVEVLEEMARGIYREWFVHFRFPGHEDATFVDSPLGPIPEGWEVRTLDALATIDKGLSYKGAYLTDDGVPMANLKCLRPGGGFRRDGTKPYSGPHKPRHMVASGDLIMANTDLTQAGTVIGSPAFVPRSGFESGGIISHHLFVIRCLDRSRLQWLYESFCDERFRSFARGVASGATVLGFRPADLLSYPLVSPPPNTVAQFATLRGNLAGLAEDLTDANDRLAAIRDLLLPRLVTGRIDVSSLDLDALVEGSAA